MTIYQIKQLTKDTEPYFFSPKTLRFFGQKMRSFKVKKVEINGKTLYKVSAPLSDKYGADMGEGVHYFEPSTRKLLNEREARA
jgi:hypothetical protein